MKCQNETVTVELKNGEYSAESALDTQPCFYYWYALETLRTA